MGTTLVHSAGKLIGKIHIIESKSNGKKEFIDSITNSISKDKYSGFGGFKEKTWLRRFLPPGIFGEYKGEKVPEYRLPNKELNKLISNALIKSYKVLPSPHTNIFVFPTFSSFVKHQMKGSTGYSPYKNTIHMYVYPEKVIGWQQEISNTIAHEYTHSVVMRHHKWRTLLDSLAYEGLAEHFRERIVGGGRAPWTIAISKEQIQRYWRELKPQINSKDYKLYHKVFFEGKSYPRWTGYTIGYNIFKSFLKNEKSKDWKQIVKNNSTQILAKSNF